MVNEADLSPHYRSYLDSSIALDSVFFFFGDTRNETQSLTNMWNVLCLCYSCFSTLAC